MASESGTESPKGRGLFSSIGLGLIAGAADDDPSAIGTYAAAGARFGPAFLWVTPLIFPMLFAVVYLPSKLGQICGKGLFEVIREHYPRWTLYFALVGVLIGNTFVAAADIGGMAAALQLLVPVATGWIIVAVTLTSIALQLWGSYLVIRTIFQWLALSLLGYVVSAFLVGAEWLPILKATFVPTIRFDREFLLMLVAIIGASLSAYIYTWQSNQEVEDKIAMGRTQPAELRGATAEEVKQARRDAVFGALF